VNKCETESGYSGHILNKKRFDIPNDISKFNSQEGFGINQIKSRINGMKGKINIDSKLDMGTIITIDVPIQ
jgi:signal transduction histidine kinase